MVNLVSGKLKSIIPFLLFLIIFTTGCNENSSHAEIREINILSANWDIIKADINNNRPHYLTESMVVQLNNIAPNSSSALALPIREQYPFIIAKLFYLNGMQKHAKHIFDNLSTEPLRLNRYRLDDLRLFDLITLDILAHGGNLYFSEDVVSRKFTRLEEEQLRPTHVLGSALNTMRIVVAERSSDRQVSSIQTSKTSPHPTQTTLISSVETISYQGQTFEVISRNKDFVEARNQYGESVTIKTSNIK